MLICPECNRGFETEKDIVKHFSICWKYNHPHHKSAPAPHIEDIEIRQINADIMNFFNSFKE